MHERSNLRVVYRIVKHDPPSVEDFLPASLIGILRAGASGIDPRVFTGISVFAAERQAAALARHRPWLGAFVAKVRPPDNAIIERTFVRGGHHTVWADPEELRRHVLQVVRVR